MTPFGDTGRRRLVVIGLLAAPLALAGWVGAGIAQGAGVPAPSMEVHPKTDLKYGQTVEIRAQHLPKGSGSVVATICGLQDTAGATIANPSPGDCASPSTITTLAVEKAWQPNGEFDTHFSLPASTQTFGADDRACDQEHHCALVVADANATAPVYRLVTTIFFADQANVSPPAPTTSGAASGGAVPGSASSWAPAVIGDTTNTSATTGNATTTANVRNSGSTTPGSTLSTRSESTAAFAGGPGSSQDPNGAGSTGGTTSGTVSGSSAGSGQGDVSGSGGGPGPSVGPGGGTSGGGPGPTSPPTTASPLPVTVPPTVPPATVPPATVPPATLPPATLPPATVPPPTIPPPSDPVCADLSDVVQLVGGDPSQLLGDCNLTGTPATPTAPVPGIVGPLPGRH